MNTHFVDRTEKQTPTRASLVDALDEGAGSQNRIFQDRFAFMANYMIAQLDEIPPQRCPCGFARRAFAASPDNVASMHIVDIQKDARTHYHKRMTEIYLVLEGEGQMELDGQLFPVKAMTAVYIRPGCRHRAVGQLRIVNIPVPSFDESDEWFDGEQPPVIADRHGTAPH